MIASHDLGLIPEPILEEMGARYGSKYAVLQAPNPPLVATLLATIDAGTKRDREALQAALRSAQPAVRDWAAVWLGQGGADDGASAALVRRIEDASPAVRVAAGRALGSAWPSRRAARGAR